MNGNGKTTKIVLSILGILLTVFGIYTANAYRTDDKIEGVTSQHTTDISALRERTSTLEEAVSTLKTRTAKIDQIASDVAAIKQALGIK